MSVIPHLYAQATLKFTGAAVPLGAAVVFGISNQGDADPSALANDVEDAWQSGGMKDLYTPDTVLSSILIKKGPNDTGPFVERTMNHPGTASGEPGYAGASLLIRKNTGLGGRKNTGRMFVPGIAEDNIELGGGIESTYLDGAQDAADAFLLRLVESEENQIPMVILHSSGSAQPPEVLTLAV